MSKHTPGPWVADLETYPIMVRSQSETWPLVDEIGNEEGRAGVFIANTGENKVNARLIAAAPDLLETIRKLRAMCADFGAHTACEVASAAIFKATGEQT